ncbi:hypothetical protein HK405_010878, partial [Cladochytrium tenue]
MSFVASVSDLVGRASPHTVKNVIIVGGAFAGIAIADSLLRTLGSKAKILLIDERDAFFFAVRALVPIGNPKNVDVVWRPFTEFAPGLGSTNFAQGRAIRLTSDRVELANGRAFPFDFAVVASGTFSPSPGKTLQVNRPDFEREIERISAALQPGKARAVTVIGGGQVGVELACHLCSHIPHLEVTLVHRSGSLLSSMVGISQAFRDTVLDRMHKLFPNLRVELGQQILEDPPIPEPYEGFTLKPQILTTSGGITLRPDATFLTTGNVPNSGFVSAGLGPQVLDAKGFVRTRPTGQIIGFPHIFAAGDVADLDRIKLAKMARSQAEVIAYNLAALIDTSEAPTGTISADTSATRPEMAIYEPFTLSARRVRLGEKGAVAEKDGVVQFLEPSQLSSHDNKKAGGIGDARGR